MASNDSTLRTCIHSRICLMRNGGATSGSSSRSRADGPRSKRFGRSFVVVTGFSERFDASCRADFAGRIDAEGAEESEVVDVDAELHFVVVLDDELRRGLASLRGRHFFPLALLVQADRGVEHHV